MFFKLSRLDCLHSVFYKLIFSRILPQIASFFNQNLFLAEASKEIEKIINRDMN